METFRTFSPTSQRSFEVYLGRNEESSNDSINKHESSLGRVDYELIDVLFLDANERVDELCVHVTF